MYDTYSTVQYSTRSYMANTIWYNIIYDTYTVHDRTWLIQYGTTSYTCTIHQYSTHDRARRMRYSTGSYRYIQYGMLASSQPNPGSSQPSLPSSASIIAAAKDAPPARPRLVSPLPCRARWRFGSCDTADVSVTCVEADYAPAVAREAPLASHLAWSSHRDDWTIHQCTAVWAWDHLYMIDAE